MGGTSLALNVEASLRDGVMAFIGSGWTRLMRADETMGYYDRADGTVSAEWVKAYVEWFGEGGG